MACYCCCVFPFNEQEEAAFRINARKIEAERDQSLFICHLQYGGHDNNTRTPDIACQELCRASVDFQYLARAFSEAQVGIDAEDKWHLLRGYRY